MKMRQAPSIHGLKPSDCVAGRSWRSDVLPDGWVEGRDINTKNTLIKYLGMFLGAPADVAKNGKKKSPAR